MVSELVPGIPDEATKKEWTSAAQRWRLPFWDWAIRQSGTGEYGVPQIVQLEQVKVLKLGSKDKESVNNPLYKFTNKIDGQEVSMDDPKMGAQRLRYTDTDDKVSNISPLVKTDTERVPVRVLFQQMHWHKPLCRPRSRILGAWLRG